LPERHPTVYVSALLESVNATGPIFVIVLLGLGLRRIGLIDDHFVEISSRLVFSLCLPVLLFTTISEIDLAGALDPELLGFALASAALTFLLAWLAAIPFAPRPDRGVFTQAAFRSNLGVIGLALSANAYGSEGLALASILMAAITVAYNVLSVIVLSVYADAAMKWRRVLVDILKNPLIITIFASTLIAWFGIPVPSVIRSTGEYLGSLALPLALLGTGAAMDLRTLRNSGRLTTIVVVLKTLALPAVVTFGAIALQFSPMETGVIFLLFVSPTATASYIMVKSMGGDDRLAANLIMTTTLVGILTTSLGLFLLRVEGLA